MPTDRPCSSKVVLNKPILRRVFTESFPLPCPGGHSALTHRGSTRLTRLVKRIGTPPPSRTEDKFLCDQANCQQVGGRAASIRVWTPGTPSRRRPPGTLW